MKMRRHSKKRQEKPTVKGLKKTEKALKRNSLLQPLLAAGAPPWGFHSALPGRVSRSVHAAIRQAHARGPSRPGSRASATPRQLFSPGRASCGFRRVSGVLIACAEEETKAWALMAAPGGGCSHIDTTGRPNARGLT